MKPVIHTIGEFTCPDSEVLHVDWNGRGMMVATGVGNRVIRGSGLLYLLPDVLHRVPLNIRIGTCIAPSAPIIRTVVTHVCTSPDLPVCTQRVPDLLLDFPKGTLVFESASRLVVARWDRVLALGWRGSSFWFALPNIAYVIHPRTPVPPTNRIEFLRQLISTRTPTCFVTELSEGVQQRYDLRQRFLADRIIPLELAILATDDSSIHSAVALSERWDRAISQFRNQGIDL
jgi:hypothetical protein